MGGKLCIRPLQKMSKLASFPGSPSVFIFHGARGEPGNKATQAVWPGYEANEQAKCKMY